MVGRPAHRVAVVQRPVDPLAADPARVGACAQALGLGSVGAVISASLLGHVTSRACEGPRLYQGPPTVRLSRSQWCVTTGQVGKPNRRTLHLGSDGRWPLAHDAILSRLALARCSRSRSEEHTSE